MKYLWLGISYLKEKLAWSITIFMALGIIYGAIFEVTSLKLYIIPLTFLMVYPMMVTLKIEELFKSGGTKANLIALVLNFGVMPFIAFGVGKLFFIDKPLLLVGLLLSALLPTSGMTISWTGFAKGNMHTAVKMTVIGLIVGSLVTPIYIKLLVGTTVTISLLEVFKQIMLIVFLPMILGYLTQKIIIKIWGESKFNTKIKPNFPTISTLGVLGVVFVAMALKAKSIIGNPKIILISLIPISILYFINYAISTFIGKKFLNRGDAIALVYGTVMRNLSIALAIAMTVFGKEGSDIALIISLAYIIQVKSAAWYVKFSNKIFGIV